MNSKVPARQDDESSPFPLDTSDIAHFDFSIFVPLKDALRGRRFADDGDLQNSFPEELRRFGLQFYGTGVERLMQR
jgi:hypothetical protein